MTRSNSAAKKHPEAQQGYQKHPIPQHKQELGGRDIKKYVHSQDFRYFRQGRQAIHGECISR